MSKKLHLAIATQDIGASVADYSQRLACDPCLVVPNEYALWRTKTINLSIRRDTNSQAGELRHLGWEDPDVESFTIDTDTNGIVWEQFTAQQQADEINQAWPDTKYLKPKT